VALSSSAFRELAVSNTANAASATGSSLNSDINLHRTFRFLSTPAH
jgi:hypothetical protein